jgi:phosphoribosylcarboxyaminoimidazole (NCAIR) mutase
MLLQPLCYCYYQSHILLLRHRYELLQSLTYTNVISVTVVLCLTIGMSAAMTPVPIIGVPVQTKALNGMDSLLSMVQMPRGIPVATVAIGNAVSLSTTCVSCFPCCLASTAYMS